VYLEEAGRKKLKLKSFPFSSLNVVAHLEELDLFLG
jgi:hypothetical protein